MKGFDEFVKLGVKRTRKAKLQVMDILKSYKQGKRQFFSLFFFTLQKEILKLHVGDVERSSAGKIGTEKST